MLRVKETLCKIFRSAHQNRCMCVCVCVCVCVCARARAAEV